MDAKSADKARTVDHGSRKAPPAPTPTPVADAALPNGGEAGLIARLSSTSGRGDRSQVAIVRGLQRTYGNAALQRVLERARAGASEVDARIRRASDGAAIQRKIIDIGNEKVEVSDAKEAEETAEAKKIIDDVKSTYGVELSSADTVQGIKDQYTKVPKAVTDALKTRQWRMIELRSLAKALKTYAPILGGERANSTRKDAAQELTTVGKVEQAINVNTPAGQLDTTTLGEYFRGKKAFGLFKKSETSRPDFGDEGDQLVGTFVHEVGHALLAYAYDDFVKNGSDGFWTDQDTKSGKAGAEAPITTYGAKNAREDLCEAIMMFVVKPNVLKDGQGAAKGIPKNPAPVRYAFMEKLGKSWVPPVKDAPQLTPSPGGSSAPSTPTPTAAGTAG